MSLFFKHLSRSIKKKPAQPIILIFTIALAVFVCIVSLSLKSSLSEEQALSERASCGGADISITLSSSSSSRFIFTEDVRELLGDGALCAGYYEIYASLPDETVVLGAAVDFLEIGQIFDFKFSEYGSISAESADFSAFISRDFAKARGLSVGDSFSVNIFGTQKEYVVSGISEEPFIKTHDIMVDIAGVMRLLAEKSIFAFVIGDDFKPSSRVLIDIKDGTGVSEAIELLKKNAAFADKNIELVAETSGAESMASVLGLGLDFAVVMACLLAALVSFCCLFILSSERREENQSFIIAGARPMLLNFMQYAEMLVYWLVGSAVGFLGALPFGTFVQRYIGFKFSSFKIRAEDALFGIFIILAASMLTATIFIFGTERGRAGKRRGSLRAGLLFAAFVLGYVLIYTAPQGWRMYIGICLVVISFLLMFYMARAALRLFALGLCAYFEKRRRKNKNCPASFYYSLKNVFSVSALHNAARLISISVGIVVCVYTIVISGWGYVRITKELFRDEYVILNGTSRLADKLVAGDGISDVYQAFISSGEQENGIYTSMISVSDKSVLSDSFDIESLPVGNGAVISRGQAEMLSLKVGDSYTAGGMDFEIREIIESGTAILIFDCRHFGIDYNILVPRMEEGITRSSFLQELSTVSADEVASIVSSSELMNAKLGVLEVFIRCANMLLPLAAVFGLVGIIDTLSESYRARRCEFELYKTAGMSSTEISKMKLYEISLSLLFGIIFGAASFALVLPAMREAMFSLSYDILNSFLYMI